MTTSAAEGQARKEKQDLILAHIWKWTAIEVVPVFYTCCNLFLGLLRRATLIIRASSDLLKKQQPDKQNPDPFTLSHCITFIFSELIGVIKYEMRPLDKMAPETLLLLLDHVVLVGEGDCGKIILSTEFGHYLIYMVHRTNMTNTCLKIIWIKCFLLYFNYIYWGDTG